MSHPRILNLDASQFDATLASTTQPVLVDFWAPWCGPCKAIAPVLDELAEEMGDKVCIIKINVDDNQELAARFSVRAIPTLLILKNGQVVHQMVGLKSKTDLIQQLNPLV